MSNPLQDIFNTNKQGTKNPLLDLYNTPTQGAVTQPSRPQGATAAAQDLSANDLREAAVNGTTPDPLWKQGALAAAQSIAGMAGSITRTASKIIPSLSQTADNIDRFVAGITPTQSGENPNAEAAVQTLGTLFGEVGANVAGFRAASGVASGLGAVAKYALPEITKSALTTISNASRITELVTKQFVNASDAARFGNAIAALPKNIVAGLGLQAAIDPESLATPKGLAMGLGMSSLGALMEAKDNTTSVSRTAKNIDRTLPLYEQRAQEVIQQHADLKVPEMRELAQDFRTNLIDRLNPIKVFANVVQGTDDLYKNVQLLVNGSNSRISEMVNNGTVGGGFADLTNQTVGLKQILAPLSKAEYEKGGALDRLLLARRVLDEGIQDKTIANNNRPVPKTTVPLSTADATQIVANAPDHLVAAADQVQGYMNTVKEYGIKRGVLSQEAVNALDAQNPNYIPLKREVNKIMDPALKSIDSSFGVGKVIQRMFGSDRDILSPIDNVRDFTTSVMRASDRNAVGQELLSAVDSNPIAAEAMGVEKLTMADRYADPRLYYQADNLKNTLAQNGIQIGDKLSQELIAQYGPNFDPATNVLTVQTGKGIQKLKISPELAKTYKSLSPPQMNFLGKMLSIPTQAIRTGTTAALDFAGVNLIRDSFDAALQSEYGFKWGQDNLSQLFPKVAQSFKNTGKGFAEAVRQGQTYSDFKSAGADYGDVARIGSNFGNVFDSIRPMSKGEIVQNAIMHPIDALKELTRPFEEAARIGEFISNREHGASLQEAGLAARNVTTDFAQQGASMQGLNQMTAFLNPAIQSLDRNYQTLMRDPRGLAAKGIAAITLPSMALWFANRNDKQINDMRKTPAGATYWFVRTGDKVVRIPKPFIYGQVFGTMIENALDHAVTKDPQSIDRAMSALIDQAEFNVIPNGISIPMQLSQNKDIYTGGDIIPESLKDVDPQMQYTLGTSPLAQHISKFLYNASGGVANVSPIQLDWLAKNVGSNVAKDIVSLSGDKTSLSDYPFFRRFVAPDVSMSVEPIQTFYNNAKQYNGVVETVNRMATSNASPEAINKYLSDHMSEFAHAGLYAEGQKQLKEMQKTIWQIHTGPFSENEKRGMINQMTQSAIEMARGVNESVK